MKKLSFVFAGLALVASAAFTSCEKTPAPSADEGTKSIALSINFGGVATKTVDGELEAGFAPGDDYTSLQIYFTNDAGDIKYAYNATLSDAGQETPAGEIWDNLADAANSNGVKFIGLDAVSGVYVTANAPLADDIYGGAVSNKNVKVSAINELLKIENIDATEANAMPYAGACIQLQPLGSTQISADAGEVVVGDGAEGAEYWKAELSIRPVVSRFEVSKVGVKTSGTTYFKEVDNEGVKVLEPCDDTDSDVKYKVEWSEFDADLIGIYMSNFYKSSPLFPNKTEIKDWTAVLFATPGFTEGVSPIAEGKWTALTTPTDINAGISYANYSNGYQNFTNAHVGTTSGTTNYLFDGGSDASAVVVPFNFFVPYSLSDRSASADDVADLGAACPALHFQFKKPENLTISYTSVQYKTSGSWQNVADNNLKQQLQNAVAWPNSTDGIAYANVTKFLNEDKLTELTIKPGLIYKVQEVVVEPVNLSVSTKDTDQFNVYVVVKVVGFDVRNVYPVFD